MSELDIVVLGASGFVGRLVADHLATAAPPGLRIGLAGRSTERLAQVRAELGEPAAAWPLLRADTDDAASLDRLATAARVVATTVGPYARHGMPVVAACARAGTHYADLSGEVLFIREAIARHHEDARRSGARIVTSCGFDSVPSDLAALLLADRAAADGAGTLGDTTLVVESIKGGISGGTIDSMRNLTRTLQAEPSLRPVVADPFALSPDREAEPDPGEQPDWWPVFRDRGTGRWLAPFAMASVNSRIVRRSNALLGHAYGRSFRYRELASGGRGLRGQLTARGISAGTAALAAGMSWPVSRKVLDAVLPSPGQGPSAERRAGGHFRMRTRTTTTAGRRYAAIVAAQGDPGYAATAVMLGQAALALARDGARLPERAGVLTPASALGGVLVERLRDQGFTIGVEPT